MGSAIAPPFNNSRRLRWAAARAASVQICSTLPQSAGGAPNFTGFARRRDPLLRPVAPGCARLCRPVPSRTILHRPAPSHPAPFAAQPRRTPVPSRSSAIAPRPLRTPVPSHPGPSRHFFNRCHCFSRRHLPRKPTLIQPYSLRGNRWKSTTGQSLLTRCFFFSSC